MVVFYWDKLIYQILRQFHYSIAVSFFQIITIMVFPDNIRDFDPEKLGTYSFFSGFNQTPERFPFLAA